MTGRTGRRATIVLVGGYLVWLALCGAYLLWSVVEHGGADDADIGAGLAVLAAGLPWSMPAAALNAGGVSVALLVAAPVLNLVILCCVGRTLDRRG